MSSCEAIPQFFFSKLIFSFRLRLLRSTLLCTTLSISISCNSRPQCLQQHRGCAVSCPRGIVVRLPQPGPRVGCLSLQSKCLTAINYPLCRDSGCISGPGASGQRLGWNVGKRRLRQATHCACDTHSPLSTPRTPGRECCWESLHRLARHCSCILEIQ